MGEDTHSNSQDSSRLKETFFSQSPDSAPVRKLFFRGWAVSIIVFFAISFILLKYQIIILPRSQENQGDKNLISLLNNNIISSLEVIEPEGIKTIPKNSLIHLTIPPRETVNLRINFKNYLNLTPYILLLTLRKDGPLNLSLVLKDIHFFSNSLHPIVKRLKKTTRDFFEVIFDWSDHYLQNTNLFRIRQLTFSFHNPNKRKKQNILIRGINLTESPH